MTAPDRLQQAAAEYVLAEAAVLRFDGDRTGPEFEALQLAWQSSTVGLVKAARSSGRGILARIGGALRFGRRKPAPAQPVGVLEGAQ